MSDNTHPVYYDDGTVYPDGPLTGHEVVRAYALFQRLAEALATIEGKFREERNLLELMRLWLEWHKDTPGARRRLRENIANPPRILGDAT